MSEPYWEPLAGGLGPAGPPGSTGPTGAQGPAGAAGSIPPRLDIVCQTITDWNNAVDNGWYMGSAAANSPVAEWCYGLVTQHNSSWITQQVYRFAASSQAYIRHKFNGTWGGWTPCAMDYQVGMFQTGALSNDTQYGWNVGFPVPFKVPPRTVMLTLTNWNTNLDAFGFAATNIQWNMFDLYVRNILNGGNFGINWLAIL